MLISKKSYWLPFAVISAILITVLAFEGLVRVIAYAEQVNNPTYVEDVRVITSEKGKTSDAEAWCRENGYVFTGIDLNEKSGENKNAYLCYKTTDNKAKALTDIRVLAMDEGYSLYDYDQMVEQIMSQNSGTAQTMYNTSQEFIEKYNQGSPRAKDAYEGLNLFYVSDDGNQKLGDYILAGKADKTFYTKMIIQASAFAVTMTLSLLNIGVAAYENDLVEETQSYQTSNWGEMLEQSNLASMIEDNHLSTDEMDDLDQKYNDIARDLFEKIQEFATDYENAKTNYEANGGTIDYESGSSRKSKKNTDSEEETDAVTDAATKSAETTAVYTTGGETALTEAKTEEQTEVKTEANTETQTEVKTEAKTEAQTEVKTEAKTETQTEVKTEANTEAQTEVKTEAKSEAQTKEEDADDGFSLREYYKDDLDEVKQGFNEVKDKSDEELFEESAKASESTDSSDEEEEESDDEYYISCFLALNDYYYDDDTKLGDWLIDTGKLTSDEVDYRDIYPLVEAMGTVQADIVSLTGICSATYNLNENETNEDFRSELDELRQAIKEYNGNDNDSLDIWQASENYEGAQLAFTNENIRKTQASNSIGITSEEEKLKSKFQYVMKWVSIVMSFLTIVVGVLKIVSFAVSLSSAATSVAATFIAALAGATASAVAAVTVVLLVVIVILIVVFLIIKAYKGNNKSDDHSDYPNYVFDAVDKSDGDTATVRYKGVLGDTSDSLADPTDVNCKQQDSWVILNQSQDPYAGSPITVTKDSNGNDITFRTVKDSNAFQDGYDCAEYYGNRNPADLNEYCDDKDSTLYLHYTTEDSLEEGTPADKETEEETGTTSGTNEEDEDKEVNYVGDMIVSTGNDVSEAKAGITSHSGKFYVLDYNFSPDQDFATYIGYSITTDKSKAFTDLRVAPYQGNNSNSSSITYGDSKYTRIGTLSYYVEPGSKGSSNGSSALYYTTDTDAGSPILADGLLGVSDPSKLYDNGAQPVSFFGNDIAYNLNTEYGDFYNSYDDSLDKGERSNYLNWYGTKKSNTINDIGSTYLCYTPETKYTEGTKYLSGVFFYGGHDWEDCWWHYGDIEGKISDFTTKLHKDPHVGTKETINLANPFSDLAISDALKNSQCYIGYTWSYNPKRAITHAYIYQGDSYASFSLKMNYSVSKQSVNTGNSVGYTASTYFYQGASFSMQKLVRYPDPSNCFRSFNGMGQGEDNIGQNVMDGYTENLPNGIDFGWTKHVYLPTVLYVGGHQDGVEGLTLDDVVISTNRYNGTNVDLSGETTLDGNAASGSFYPVVDMKNPHETEAFNFGYPDFYRASGFSDNCDGELQKSNQPCFMYIKGAREDKKTYISSITVGSYSRDQYEASNEIDEDDRDDTLESVDKIVDNTALIQTAAGCADEMIVYNIGVDSKGQSKAWYNLVYDDDELYRGLADIRGPEDVRCAYIGVTRTNSKNDAITGVLLYQTNADTPGNELTYDSVKYTCAGSSYPIYMNGKKYYLYYTKNSGVSPGKPIEDIKIDNTPIISGYATNLCGDSGHSEPYGNPDQTYFIHLKYTPDRGDFFNKMYVTTGSTGRKAQCELLTQGCNEFLDIDLNNGVNGETMLIGFRRGTIDWDSVNGKKTEKLKKEEYETQTQEAIYDIIVTNGAKLQEDGFVNRNMFYYPAAPQNLNSDKGDELYLYIATPWYSSRYNKNHNASTTLPQDEYTGYLTSIAVAESDRVPYNTSQNTEGSSDLIPWEYIMESDNVTHANFNSGETNFNGQYDSDCRIHMFGQRSDGSVKSSGEITGGFLEAQYAVGELNKQ